MPLEHSPIATGAEGGTGDDPSNCTICKESLRLGDTFVTSCNHNFHLNCLQKWMDNISTCPICRKPCSIDLFLNSNIQSATDASASHYSTGAVPK